MGVFGRACWVCLAVCVVVVVGHVLDVFAAGHELGCLTGQHVSSVLQGIQVTPPGLEY